MAGRTTKNDKIIDAALELAEERGWHNFSLADIARHSKIPLSDVFQNYRDKIAILAGYMARADVRMLKLLEAEENAGEPTDVLRERLFDAIMFRFDALSKDRNAIRAIYAGIRRDPVAAAKLAHPMRRTVQCILETAEINGGRRRAFWQPALALILMRVSAVWLEDETEDMARTMAALDANLARADKIRRRLPMRRPKTNG